MELLWKIYRNVMKDLWNSFITLGFMELLQKINRKPWRDLWKSSFLAIKCSSLYLNGYHEATPPV